MTNTRPISGTLWFGNLNLPLNHSRRTIITVLPSNNVQPKVFLCQHCCEYLKKGIQQNVDSFLNNLKSDMNELILSNW